MIVRFLRIGLIAAALAWSVSDSVRPAELEAAPTFAPLAAAQEHAAVQEHGAAGEQIEPGHQEDFGSAWNEFMIEEVSDAQDWHLPLVPIHVHLPHWPPLQIGPLTLDLSPTKHVVSLLLAAVLTALVLIWVAQRVHARHPTRAPRGIANMIEAFVVYLRDEVVMRGVGHGGERYAPFVMTLFFFIFFANMMGLVPFGSTATGNISVTAALALLALIVIEIGGLVALGPRGYMKTIFVVPQDFPWYGKILMGAIMAPVEILAKLARIFALAVRLFANMTAGHIVILALVGLILMAGAQASGASRWVGSVAPAFMVLGVMLLEILIALLQAYIFAMLTAVFIGLVRHAH